MTTAPAPTAMGPATDTGSDDDTGDSTRNDANEHQDPQNAKNGRSTPQPQQTTQHPPQACEQLLAGWIAGASSRRRHWRAPGHQDDPALDKNEHHGSGMPITTHHPPLASRATGRGVEHWWNDETGTQPEGDDTRQGGRHRTMKTRNDGRTRGGTMRTRMAEDNEDKNNEAQQ